MHSVTERVYIFGVFNSKRNAAANLAAHKETINSLKSKYYTPTEVTHRYNGTDETLIMLYGTNLTQPVVDEIAKNNFQESYLVVYHDGVAELICSDKTSKIMGDFISVSESEAKAKDGYCKIGNQWFVIE